MNEWHGFGTANNVWENVKRWGGFFGPDGEIWGVGYSDEDGNGKSGDYKNGIISAEWTAGAINMLQCLITHYTDASTSSKYTAQEQVQAKQYVIDLQKDHDSMFKNLMSLRSDQYPTSSAYSTVRPADYDTLLPIPTGNLAFVYASNRYEIPFGWFANPIPRTTSTSWAIMLHYNFNPFKAGGDYKPYSFGTSLLTDLVVLPPVPPIKPTDSDIKNCAQEIAGVCADGFQWEDVIIMIRDAEDYLNANFLIETEEETELIKAILDSVIDQTDIAYLPDGFFDPLFKAMIHPFVDLFLEDGDFFSIEELDRTPTEQDAWETAEKIVTHYQDGFQWCDLAMTVKFAICSANSYSSSTDEEKVTFTKEVMEIVINQTDTPYLPDYFTDWIFKRFANAMIDALM